MGGQIRTGAAAAQRDSGGLIGTAGMITCPDDVESVGEQPGTGRHQRGAYLTGESGAGNR